MKRLRVAFPPPKVPSQHEASSVCPLAAMARAALPVAPPNNPDVSHGPTRFKDPSILVLASEHTPSLRISDELDQLVVDPAFNIESKKISPGIIEVVIKLPSGPYSCRRWPIRIGGAGSFVEDTNIEALHTVCSESSGLVPFAGSTPVAVRFHAPIAHINVDDSGFLDYVFWQPLLMHPNVSLLAIVHRLVQALNGPLRDCDFERWTAEADQTAKKTDLVKAYHHMCVCKQLVSADQPCEDVNLWQAGWLAPSFLQAFSRPLNESLPTAYDARKQCREISPGIFSFELFTSEFCQVLVKEVETFEASALPRRRPNTMNNYGLILNDIGMHGIMSAILETIASPLAHLLYPEEIVAKGLDHHHTFVVEYDAGGDLHLDMHHDASEVTLNVCLGRDFTGSGLRFCGEAGASNHRSLVFTYEHKIGHCIMHLGRQRHGADTISSGSRMNLIIWARSSSFRAAAAKGETPPDGFPKLPETIAPDSCCLSKTNDEDYLYQLSRIQTAVPRESER